MPCNRAAQIHAYHDGELAAPERAAVEAHVASCEPCAALLAELRSLSRLLAEAPLPAEAEASPMGRYYGAFHKAMGRQQRDVVRLTGWLTAAAAVVIAATLFRAAPPAPRDRPAGAAAADAALPIWQQVAVTPAAEQEGERANGELVVVAQWMADDLAVGGR
jgi:anti-sigma factor RsiW